MGKSNATAPMHREIGLASLLLLAMVVPTAQASTSTVDLAVDKTVVDLPEGRADFPLYGKLWWDGRPCASDVRMTVYLDPGPFPKWAGAAVSPDRWTWHVPRMAPAQTLFAQSLVTVLWDTESIAHHGQRVEHTYTIQASAIRVEGGPCVLGSADAPTASQVSVTAVWNPPAARATEDVAACSVSTEDRTPLLLKNRDEAMAYLPLPLGVSAAAVAIALYLVARRR
jgi:hypothetical protein